MKVPKYGRLYPRETRATPAPLPPKVEAPLHDPRCQALIISYRPDFYWLAHCLASLKKFSVGFMPPVVCVLDAVGCPNSYIPGRDLTNRTPRQIIKEIVG